MTRARTALGTTLTSVAQRMLADFEETAGIRHRGSKGTVREGQLLSTYLDKYLPRNVVAAHNGEVVSADGQVSEQCDILIMDPATPKFWDMDNYRIVPAECIYGVIEVKSRLDGTQLKDTWKKLSRLKSLPKTAYVPNPGGRSRTVYGKTWNHFPTVGMLFAYEGADLTTLGHTLSRLAAKEAPLEHRLDSIWVLNQGYLAWTNPVNGNIDPSPRPGAGIVTVRAEPEQMLLALTAHLHLHFGNAWMPPFNILEYMGGDSMGLTEHRWWLSDDDEAVRPDGASRE